MKRPGWLGKREFSEEEKNSNGQLVGGGERERTNIHIGPDEIKLGRTGNNHKVS